jgi:outer membrane immunogenic protein
MKRIFVAGAAFAALMTNSVAADFPAESVDIWSGYYLGVQGGYSWNDVDFIELQGTPPITPIGDGALDADSFTVGLYGGYNHQFGNWVIGLDGSISYMDIDEALNDADPGGGNLSDLETFEIEMNWLSTVRARVGYAFGDFQIFAAGGLAIAGIDVTLQDTAFAPTDTDSEVVTGWTLGAGLETLFAENCSARLEYLYVAFEEEYIATPGLTAMGADTDLDQHIVRAGIAYRF